MKVSTEEEKLKGEQGSKKASLCAWKGMNDAANNVSKRIY